MNRNGHTNIMGFTDPDWDGNALDHQLTTGYCMIFGENLVSQKSKKQHVVAWSTVEAEYHFMAIVACALIWIKSLLADLGFPYTAHMTLCCDTQATMHIASNPVFHEKTKHIKLDYHCIC